jgi:Domain of unknown function (DUF2383)
MILSATREIAVLNDLLEGVVTSGQDYRQAAEAGKNPNLRSLFERRAAERRSLAADIRFELRRLGGTPAGDQIGPVTRSRKWLDHVEMMEARLRHKFELALGTGGLSVPVLVLLGRAYVAVRTGHDQIRSLKFSSDAADRGQGAPHTA